MSDIKTYGNLVWSVADLLRGHFGQAEYGRIVLPFVVMRRLDCLLAPAVEATKAEADTLPADIDPEDKRMLLLDVVSQEIGEDVNVYNASGLTFEIIRGQDPAQLASNLVTYLAGFPEDVREIFEEHFGFLETLKKLGDKSILWQVFEKFCQIDLAPQEVTNIEMGYIFEDLIRRFSEVSNETAGEHFTPREVVQLIVKLLIDADDEKLSKPGVVRHVYDPACGTGGMLAYTEQELKGFNPNIIVELFGQEMRGESYGICKSDMLITGHEPDKIAFGNTLTNDQHANAKFHYMISNPPYGVDWKGYKTAIVDESKQQGGGRFVAGLPRTSDGQLLFLQHMVSKMRDDADGSRIAVVMSGSPLFVGNAGSGESEIRKYLLENDLVEAIVALPTDIFYNTGIQTYVWILTNRKEDRRQGKVQLIDAGAYWSKLRKALGMKRREIQPEHQSDILRIYSAFQPTWQSTVTDADGNVTGGELILGSFNGQAIERLDDGGKIRTAPVSLIFDNEDFGYRTITVERPQRDEDGNVIIGQRGKTKGKPQADASLRDTENVPLKEDVKEYFAREVKPHVPDAWVDEEKTKIGYEIPFTRHFYVFEPPRDLADIDADLSRVTGRIQSMLQELAA